MKINEDNGMNKSNVRTLLNKLKEIENDGIAEIFLHKNPDPDCIISAISFARLIIDKADIHVRIIGEIPENKYRGIDGIEYVESEVESDIDRKCRIVVFVDTPKGQNIYSAKEALEKCQKAKYIFVVDHHTGTYEGFKKLTDKKLIKGEVAIYTDPSCSSCCEVIYDIDPEVVDPQETLNGIFVETDKLKHANPQTFKTISKLCEKGATLKKVVSLVDGFQYEYARFASKILDKYTKVTKTGILVFVAPFNEFKEYFPRFYNQRQGSKEYPLLYLFKYFENIQISRNKEYPRMIVGIYPDKFVPKSKRCTLFVQVQSDIGKGGGKKMKDLGFDQQRFQYDRILKSFDDENEAMKVVEMLSDI